jgi:ABC-type lipoprotein release transport system permease subunit
MTTGAAGAVAGVVVAGWASGLIEGYLFGVQAHDELTYGGTILSVLLVCGLASYLPTSRLLLLHPATVLKEE